MKEKNVFEFIGEKEFNENYYLRTAVSASNRLYENVLCRSVDEVNESDAEQIPFIVVAKNDPVLGGRKLENKASLIAFLRKNGWIQLPALLREYTRFECSPFHFDRYNILCKKDGNGEYMFPIFDVSLEGLPGSEDLPWDDINTNNEDSYALRAPDLPDLRRFASWEFGSRSDDAVRKLVRQDERGGDGMEMIFFREPKGEHRRPLYLVHPSREGVLAFFGLLEGDGLCHFVPERDTLVVADGLSVGAFISQMDRSKKICYHIQRMSQFWGRRITVMSRQEYAKKYGGLIFNGSIVREAIHSALDFEKMLYEAYEQEMVVQAITYGRDSRESWYLQMNWDDAKKCHEMGYCCHTGRMIRCDFGEVRKMTSTDFFLNEFKDMVFELLSPAQLRNCSFPNFPIDSGEFVERFEVDRKNFWNALHRLILEELSLIVTDREKALDRIKEICDSAHLEKVG